MVLEDEELDPPLGQVVAGREARLPGADDDHVIALGGLLAAHRALP